MEALAILFVISVFVALLLPEKKSKPPSAGDDLIKGLKAAYKEITGSSGGDSGGGGGAKGDGLWDSPWSAMLLTILLGLLLTYVV